MITFDRDKFQELVLFIAEQSVDDIHFGATKLNKILFFSDFLAYGQYGAPITGATYQKLNMGPAPRELLQARDDLVADGYASIETRDRYGFVQKRVVALRSPKLDLFTADELLLVTHVIEAFHPYTAVRVSDLSHRLALGWDLAEDFTDIPYSSVFLSSDGPTEADISRGHELAGEHGWLAA